MNFKSSRFTPKKRRGLSSIVGALLFVVLMVSTFTVLGQALDSQTEIVSVSRAVADSGLKKQQEDFRINAFTDNGNPNALLSVDVENLGQNSLEIFSMIITEETDINGIYPSTVYDIPSDKSFIAPGKTNNIVSAPTVITLAVPTGLELTKVYTIKVISSLGNISTDSILCDQTSCMPAVAGPGDGSLTSTVFLDGPNGINGKISTFVMFVSNTSDLTITDVQPVFGWTAPICDDMWTNDDTGQTENKVDPETMTLCNVTPGPVPQIDLGPYASVLFKWDMVVNGDIGSTFTLCNSVTGDDGTPPIITSALTCDMLTMIDPNDCGGCGPGGTTIILVDDLLIRPELFLTLPGPFGDSSSQGIWGVNVVNPTTRDMQITKLTLVAYPPGANNNDKVFIDGCPFTAITPTTNWSCPRENTLMWVNPTGPLTIPSHSSVAFAAKVEPGSIAGAEDLDAIIVQANAFTTSGSFGKAGYQSSMLGSTGTIANVFLTDTALSRTDIKTQKLAMTELIPQSFKVTLADMDDSNATYIKSGARLVINVPRDWTDVIITSSNNFVADGDPGPDDDRITAHADGSTQIVAVTASHLGQAADAYTIEFDATPPANADAAPEILYVMYVLADGLTDDDLPIGPLSEIVLQVLHP